MNKQKILRETFFFVFFITHSILFAQEKKNTENEEISTKNSEKNQIVKLKANIIAKKKHPFRAFTQGLTQINGKIYESSGLYGQSFIAEYFWENPEKTAKKKSLPSFIFAEGIVAFGAKKHWDKKEKTQIFLLTWKENKFFSLSGDFSQKAQSFFYDNEGWGITFDGKYFITSEGSHILTIRDQNLRAIKNQQNGQILSLKVHKNQQKVEKINELEYAPLTMSNGKKIFLMANVWGSDFLIAIDKKGNVIAEVDCRDLSRENRPKESIQKQWGVLSSALNAQSLPTKRKRYKKALNGIAFFDGEKEKKLESGQKLKNTQKLEKARFLVTGKKWEWIYLVQFSPIL